jgi:uncharacterized membrane protein
MLNKNLQLSKLNHLFYRLPICHRLPNRTFKFRNHYFPVCARCTGFYIGTFSYFLAVYFLYIPYTINFIICAVLMLVPTFIDGTTQLKGTRESNNTLRFVTGLIGGIGLAIILKAIKWLILIQWGV